MLNGSVVELANQVACHVQAGRCMFSSQPSEIGVLIDQKGERSPATLYEGLKVDGESQPNGYYAMKAYLSGEQGYSFAECKEQGIPVKDSAARLIVANPFERDPLARLSANPRQLNNVFKLNPNMSELRLEPEPDKLILGTMALPGIPRFYDDPLGKPLREKPLPANYRVWQPDLPEGSEAKSPYFKELSEAIKSLKEDGVILVRAKGQVPVNPQKLVQANTNITIRATRVLGPSSLLQRNRRIGSPIRSFSNSSQAN